MTEPTPSFALLARYLAGECSDEEASRVAAWVAANPDVREPLLADLARIWGDARERRLDWDTEAALFRIKRSAVMRLMRSPRRRRPPRMMQRVGWPVTIAAALLMAIGLPALWLGVSGRLPTGWRRGDPYREYAASAGERLKITLADGTNVTLAPASRLRVPLDYRDGRRTVDLTGEALFVVVHDARHPFAVHTAGGETRDIGTSFDLRAYETETERVVVTEGEVSVRGVPVHAGELARLCDTSVAIEHHPDIDRYVAWASGRLVFHATSLRRVALDLSRWYDLDVRITDPVLAHRLFTGSYTTESPDAVLSLITAATHARYERRGRLVTISLR
jgi:transmembrane sensor